MLHTDLAEKNLLFGYSNPVMKEWYNLKQYMGKNLVNLLNVAKFIEQSLKFDLYSIAKTAQLWTSPLRATIRSYQR